MMLRKNSHTSHLIIMGLLLALFVLEGVQTYYAMNPATQPVIQGQTAVQQEKNKEHMALLKRVAKHVDLDESSQAMILTIEKVDALKAASSINTEVYENAQDGDRVINYGNRMIIYREASDEIIYDGQTPAQIQQKKYGEELQAVVAAVDQKVALPTDTPQLLTVSDPAKVQAQDPVVFKDAAAGDKVLVYQKQIIVYRPATQQIVFNGLKK